MGGLEFRGLKEMNQVLVAKNVWRIATGADSQWVRIMQAKYYPRGCFWTTNSRHSCSKLWRQLMDMRPKLQQHLIWKIGRGDRINTFAQPWFPAWTRYRPTKRSEREAKVQDLIDPQTHTWNFEALQHTFGFSVAMQISTSANLQPMPPPTSDSLLFTFAKNGKFTVKKAYQLFKSNQPRDHDRDFWAWVWKGSGLLPKLQMFIWKCVFNTVPVHAVLAKRIAILSPSCRLCGGEDETVMHAIFHCQFARAAWMSSPLGVRTDQLTGNFKETIWAATNKSLPDRNLVSFVSMARAVWRVRNDAIYGNKQPSFATCQEYFRKTEEASQLLVLCKGVLQPGNNKLVTQQWEEGQVLEMSAADD